MRLDLYDRKLLYALDVDARSTLGVLAKRVRLSKNAVNHRLTHIVEEGVIRQFYALINTKMLGYSYFKVYCKLQEMDETVEVRIIEYLEKNVPTLWLTTWEGRYDLVAGILAKGVDEFSDILNRILNAFRHHIQSYDIFIVIEAPHFKKDYLIGVPQKQGVEFEKFGGTIEASVLDDIDRRLLKALSTNARLPFVELAARLDVTADLVRYRLKKLRESGVVQGFRILIDYEKLGYQPYKVLLTTMNMDAKKEHEIIAWCAAQPHVADLIIRGIGPWNIELQIDTQTHAEFHRIFKEFKARFSAHIRNSETLLMIEEKKLDYYPF